MVLIFTTTHQSRECLSSIVKTSIAHPGNLDLTFIEPRPEDVFLPRALLGTVGWHHCTFTMHTHNRCIHSRSHRASSGLDLTDSGWRWITIFPEQIRFAKFVIYRIQRPIVHLIYRAPSYNEIKGNTSASIGTQGAPSPLSSNIATIDA